MKIVSRLEKSKFAIITLSGERTCLLHMNKRVLKHLDSGRCEKSNVRPNFDINRQLVSRRFVIESSNGEHV